MNRLLLGKARPRSVSGYILIVLQRLAAAVVFFGGWYTIMWLRSRLINDFASGTVVYFLGAAFIIIPAQIVFFNSDVRERIALRLAIAAIILAAVWLNFEERVVMPIVASSCTDTCQQVAYQRAVPFDNYVLTYTQQHGWRGD